MKTNVYVDGFNLYYGCLRKSPHRWLNIQELVLKILPHITINRIRYFTALINARASDPTQPARQRAFIQALETLPNLTVHYGHFLVHSVRMQLDPPPASGLQTVQVLKTEEKGSDVNLATFLLCDGFKGDFDQAVIVSNDWLCSFLPARRPPAHFSQPPAHFFASPPPAASTKHRG